jgi:hypothetical protein
MKNSIEKSVEVMRMLKEYRADHLPSWKYRMEMSNKQHKDAHKLAILDYMQVHQYSFSELSDAMKSQGKEENKLFLSALKEIMKAQALKDFAK